MNAGVNSQQIVRLLAEPTRRRIAGVLMLADSPLDHHQISEAGGLALRDVVDGLDRLINGGLVDRHGDHYALVADVFTAAARAEAPSPPPSAHSDQPVDVARILDTAFVDGKLVQWPSKRSKRLVVLDYLAQQFDIGKRYSERDIDDRLRAFNDDVATARRYLVDEQFLDRAAGEYWRCGGSI